MKSRIFDKLLRVVHVLPINDEKCDHINSPDCPCCPARSIVRNHRRNGKFDVQYEHNEAIKFHFKVKPLSAVKESRFNVTFGSSINEPVRNDRWVIEELLVMNGRTYDDKLYARVKDTTRSYAELVGN